MAGSLMEFVMFGGEPSDDVLREVRATLQKGVSDATDEESRRQAMEGLAAFDTLYPHLAKDASVGQA